MYKTLPLLFVSLLAAHAGPGHDPSSASYAELRGMAALYRCSGAFVSLGQRDDEPGLVLAAGHCVTGDGYLPAGVAVENHVVTDEEAEYVSFYVQKPAKDGKPGELVTALDSMRVRKIRYAAMTGVDVALFETAATLGELKASGRRVFRLADRLPKPGEKLRITSGLWGATRDCVVDRLLADNAEELAVTGLDPAPVEMKDSILMKKECLARAGWSGSPVFDPETGAIYGVVSRIPAAKDGKDPTKELASGVVASNVLGLADCAAADGRLDFTRPGCRLPRAKAAETPAARPAAPASRWPKSSARRR